MPVPILATKLYIPPPRPNAIQRHGLFARLDDSVLHKRLTLVCAPAGYGKTSLISGWLAWNRGKGETAAKELSRPGWAWVSLEEADRDPIRFFSYLIAALQTILPGMGQGIVDAFAWPDCPPLDVLLVELLNEINGHSQPFVLVLDDYHVLCSREIDSAVAYLLDHLPPQMHLLIVSRDVPSLPLARLRARGELAELSAEDLRFGLAETEEFLNQVMELNLDAAHVSALGTRTEGWVAGLQLAALSMRGRSDSNAFVQAFAGDNHFIVDYLVEEVLSRQPAPMRNFLLQTSILNQLTASLCEAVCGKEDGGVYLALLEQGNLFIVPLDDSRTWYRYHHLFGDVLRKRLTAEQPETMPELHLRACRWYERSGRLDDAVLHAIAGRGFAIAAEMIERHLPDLNRRREGRKLLGWLRAIPDLVVRSRPVLCAAYAWALMAGGELEAMEAWLGEAERHWAAVAQSSVSERADSLQSMIVVNESEFSRLSATIAIYRAARAHLLGNVSDTLTHARCALELSPTEDHLRQGAAMALLGLATWRSGELEAAYAIYAEGMERVRAAGNHSDVISSSLALADIRVGQGKLRAAMRILEQAHALGASSDGAGIQGMADVLVGMGELQIEQNRLDSAELYLRRSAELTARTGLPHHRYRSLVATARLKAARGDADGALALLDEAEQWRGRDFFLNLRPPAAMKARIWLGQDRLADAQDWIFSQGLSVHDELCYLREFEHLTMVRVLLARARLDGAKHWRQDADQLLDKLRGAAEAGGRAGTTIEILMLQSLSFAVCRKIPDALDRLGDALRLAEAENFIRVFVDEGTPMQELLAQMALSARASAFVFHLLDAFPKPVVPQATRAVAPDSPGRSVTGLIEPLSERELEVLRLLKSELSGPEIACTLSIALSTVRTHTKHIYSKLQVNTRRQAVKRADELQLLSSAPNE